MPINISALSSLRDLSCVASYDFGGGERQVQGNFITPKLVRFNAIQQHLLGGNLQDIEEFFRKNPSVEVTLSVHSPSLQKHLMALVTSVFQLVDKSGTKCLTTEQLYRGLECNENLLSTLDGDKNREHLAALPGSDNHFTPEVFADILVRGTKAKLRDSLGLTTSNKDLLRRSPVTIVTTFEDFVLNSCISARLWHIFSFCCDAFVIDGLSGGKDENGQEEDAEYGEEDFEDDFEEDFEEESESSSAKDSLQEAKQGGVAATIPKVGQSSGAYIATSYGNCMILAK